MFIMDLLYLDLMIVIFVTFITCQTRPQETVWLLNQMMKFKTPEGKCLAKMSINFYQLQLQILICRNDQQTTITGNFGHVHYRDMCGNHACRRRFTTVRIGFNACKRDPKIISTPCHMEKQVDRNNS